MADLPAVISPLPGMLQGMGEATKLGLRLRDDLSYDAWREAEEALLAVHSASMWWLGDWINYAGGEYGKKYLEAVERTDYSYGTLRDAA